MPVEDIEDWPLPLVRSDCSRSTQVKALATFAIRTLSIESVFRIGAGEADARERARFESLIGAYCPGATFEGLESALGAACMLLLYAGLDNCNTVISGISRSMARELSGPGAPN